MEERVGDQLARLAYGTAGIAIAAVLVAPASGMTGTEGLFFVAHFIGSVIPGILIPLVLLHQAVKLRDARDSDSHSAWMYVVLLWIEVARMADGMFQRDWWMVATAVAAMAPTIWILMLINKLRTPSS